MYCFHFVTNKSFFFVFLLEKESWMESEEQNSDDDGLQKHQIKKSKFIVLFYFP